MNVDLVVAGAGPAGLCHAFWRKRKDPDLNIMVVDGNPQPGGWTRTLRIEGFSCETGPQGFRPNQDSDALIEALGMQNAVVSVDPSAKLRFIARGGRLHSLPTSPRELRSTELFSAWGKLRLFLEPLCFNRSQPGESLADFVARRFGEQARPLANAMARGVFAGDAERLEAKAFSQMVEMEARHGSLIVGMTRSRGLGPLRPALCSFHGGMEALIQGLRRELNQSLWLARPAVSVTNDGGVWRVTLGGKVKSEITSKELTIAVPAHAAAPLLSDLDPGLAAELAAIPFAPVANVYLGFWQSDVAEKLRGFGFLLEPTEQSPVMGILYCSSIFPGCAVQGKFLVRAMVGGRGHPEFVDRDDDELARIALETLGKYTGIDARPLFQRVRRAPAAIPQYETGHRDRVQRIRALVSGHAGLNLRGNSYEDVSLVGQMAG